jgi:hypothetical protein
MTIFALDDHYVTVLVAILVFVAIPVLKTKGAAIVDVHKAAMTFAALRTARTALNDLLEMADANAGWMKIVIRTR